MTTIVGGICLRCGLFLAVDGSIVCRNADGAAERIRQLEAERDAARAGHQQCSREVHRLTSELDDARAEVAALQRILDQAHADRDAAIADAARMEMGLVDLKARVEGLRLIPIWGTSRDAYDHHTLAAVLALIEEAQP